MSALARYDEARAAIANAMRAEELLPLLDEFELAKLRARQIKDQALLADATEYQMRAERRLGEVLAQAKEQGLFRQGRQQKSTAGELFSRPTLAEAGIDKKLSARAQGRASIAERAFEAMIDGVRERIASGAATVIDKEAKLEEGRMRRQTRERVLGEYQQALPVKKYGVIVADPEWRFEPWSRRTGMDRSADNHYPTSCLEVIKARDVASIAADDCVLFLWATAPMLPHALAVMEAWGFDYRSNYVWAKDRVGTGYWNRNAHEHLLVGVKGNIPAPAPGTQRPSLIEGHVGKHSAKPEAFLEMIEQYFPNLPKIELNRRGPARKGWQAWGNEAGEEFDPQTGEISNTADQPAPPGDRPVRSSATEDHEPARRHPQHERAGSPDSDEDECLEIPAFLKRDEGCLQEGKT